MSNQLGGGTPKNPKGALLCVCVPAELTIQSTLTRESSGLYTVSSTLYAPVTREDRHSLYHCTLHYRLQGQSRALDSRQVKVNIFCESGPGGAALVPCSGAGWALTLPHPCPQTLPST